LPEIPTLLKGLQLATEILNDAKAKIEKFEEKPHIAIVLVGEDEASKIFVRLKEKACEKIGAKSTLFKLTENVDDAEVLDLIQKLNEDKSVHGILVQLPLPDQIDENKLLNYISPEKDVDGLTPKNIGNLLLGYKTIAPCAVDSVMKILDNVNIGLESTGLEGKNIVIISRSNLIGKPLAMVLAKNSATVTVCHSKTKDLANHTRAADIIITATGRPKFLTGDMIKEGAVVIDVGCVRVEGKTCGDVDFDSVSKKASAITPVPGGVGPLTVAMTIKNLIRCYELQKSPRRSMKE